MQIPVLDLEGLDADGLRARPALGAAVDAALADVGTFVLVGHAIPPTALDAVRTSALAFFAAPAAEKRRVARPERPAVARGYFGLPPNVVSAMGMERFSFGPWEYDGTDPYYDSTAGREHFPPNLFPPEHAPFERAARAYFPHVQTLSRKIAVLCEMALDLPAGTFVDRLVGSTGTATAIRYPGSDRPPEGDVRIMAHNDVDLYTILWIADAQRTDLLFLDRTDRWNEVPAVPGGLIVNVGDLMQRYTNDRWLATSHKVLAPRDADAGVDRFSLAYFEHPRYDTTIAPLPDLLAPGTAPRYEAVRVAEFERQRRMLIHLGTSAVEELTAPIEERLGSTDARKTE